jgi:hypothetical protein
MSENLLKFHGNFKELIPAGFTFQKLFASNYRQYCLTIKNVYTIRVWQAHGGYIEIEDYYDASKSLVEAILNESFPWHKYEPINLANGGMIHCTSLGFTIVRETNKVIPLDMSIHEPMRVQFKMEKEGKTEQEIDDCIKNLYDKYRVSRVSLEICNAIKDMHAKGWIKI